MEVTSSKINNLEFVSLDNGKLKITLCNLGASIFSIFFDNKLMTMTNEYIEDFKLPNIYNGKTIGRVANRLKGNEVDINGKKFFLKNNENKNTLHGGVDGLSNKIFKFKVEQKNKLTNVIFSYISLDGESGLPGRMNLRIIYTIFEKSNKFTIKFYATTTKTTLCNLTNHTFFTLGESSIDNLAFKINASEFIKCGVNDLIPLSEEKITKELDFRKYKRITKDIDLLRYGKQNGYDHCLICDKNTNIRLKSNNYLLKINSNFKCCQIYSDNWANDTIKWLNLPCGSNRSLAIEPQDNILNRVFLEPHEKYYRYIKYEFTKI